jgi:hypothetical protein
MESMFVIFFGLVAFAVCLVLVIMLFSRLNRIIALLKAGNDARDVQVHMASKAARAGENVIA